MGYSTIDNKGRERTKMATAKKGEKETQKRGR
jgi:hypothetical protein